jgi:chromate transport protein ChrA
MVILGRILAWLGFIATPIFLLMAGFRFYQWFTGDYTYTEAFDDPVGAAILYLMMAAVTWLLSLLVGHLVEEDA